MSSATFIELDDATPGTTTPEDDLPFMPSPFADLPATAPASASVEIATPASFGPPSDELPVLGPAVKKSKGKKAKQVDTSLTELANTAGEKAQAARKAAKTPKDAEKAAAEIARKAAFGEAGEVNEEKPVDQFSSFKRPYETHKRIFEDGGKLVKFDDVYSQIAAAAKEKVDRYAPVSTVRVEERVGKILLNSGEPFTPYGLESMARYAGFENAAAIVNFTMKNEGRYAGDLAKFLNDHMDKKAPDANADKDALLRFRKVGGQDVCRAVLSGGRMVATSGGEGVRLGGYTVVDNETVCRIVREALGDGAADTLVTSAWAGGASWLEGKSGSHAKGGSIFARDGGDMMILNLLPPDRMMERPDSPYGVGIAMRNNEVGKGSYKLMPYLYRDVCSNVSVYGKRDCEVRITQRHTGKVDLVKLLADTQKALEVAFSEGQSLLRQFDLAKEIHVGKTEKDIQKVIVSVAQHEGLTNGQAKAWWEGYNAILAAEPQNVSVLENTAFGVVEGLTLAAQVFEGETRDMLETYSTKLLTHSLTADKRSVERRWSHIVADSQRVEKEQVEKTLFATVATWN